jgi:hypothetical protein
VQAAGQVGFARYDWGVDDVHRFGDRVNEVVAAYLGQPVPADVPPVDWEAEEERTRREWRAEKAAVLLRALDGKYAAATPHHDLSSRWLTAYRGGRCVNLGIFGPTGVGKTWEAASIARALLLEFTPVLMVTVEDMLSRLMPIEDRQATLGQFQATPVLVLDDLGSERPGEFTDRMLYSLADYRNKKLLPTIVTSNLAPGVIPEGGDRLRYLEGRYNDRLLRRLFEGAAELVITERPDSVPPPRFGAVL